MTELFSLKDKVAIVTGACGLLGKKHCEALAEAGAFVVAADVDAKTCITFANDLGNSHLGIGLDVTNEASIRAAKEEVIKKYGRIDVLVNNAAINDMFENNHNLKTIHFIFGSDRWM
jgi:NAD(P)-dependent dehydrogenase (short-subunit alcohol dehydrogenase family)